MVSAYGFLFQPISLLLRLACLRLDLKSASAALSFFITFFFLLISAILLSSQTMGDNGDWVDADYVAPPDDVFEASLAERERRKNDLYEIYTSGHNYAAECVDDLMDDIKFLYGAEVAGRARLYLRGFFNDELALQAMGASWRLHSDAEWQHSRIDILAIFCVDLRDILDFVPVDCADLISFWNPDADDEADNLEAVSICIEAVHGLSYWYDFRALLREVESEHDCLQNAVVSILKQQYGDYGLWRQEARRRAAERPPIDWDEVLAS
jgi:hypothetical protein